MMTLNILRVCSACSGILVLLGTQALAQLPQTRLYALSRSGGQAGQAVDLSLTAGDDLEEIDQLIFSHPGITAVLKSPGSNTFSVQIGADVPPGTYEVRCGGRFGFSNPRRFVVDTLPEIVEGPGNETPDKATPLELDHVVNGRMESGNDVDWFRFEARQGQRIVFDCLAERIDSRMIGVVSIHDQSGRRRLQTSQHVDGSDPILVFNPPADGTYLLKLHDQTFRNGNEYVYRLHACSGPYLEYAFPPVGTAGTSAPLTLYGYNLPGGQPTDLLLRGVLLEKLDLEVSIPTEADLLHVEGRVTAVGAGTDAFSYRLPAGDKVSNPVRIGITSVPVVREQEPNDSSRQAQAVPMPVEVAGQFGRREDNDVYRFEARAGQDIFIEVFAERMAVPVDAYLIVNRVIKKEDGSEELQRLTAQDGVTTTLLQNVFETRTDDPVFHLQIPADGWYEVVVRDRYWETRGSPQLLYRLSIRNASPDFRLVAVPLAPTPGTTWPAGLRKGDQFPFSVLAFRRDGFDGPIRVSATDLPAGLACSDIILGEKQSAATLVITATEDATLGWHQIKLTGTAFIEDPASIKAADAAAQALAAGQKALAEAQANEEAKAAAQQKVNELSLALAAAQEQRKSLARDVTRQVRGATVVWSTANNDPAISRVTDHVSVNVLPELAPFQIKSDVSLVEANQSRQVLVPVELDKRNFDEKVTLAVQNLPNNVNIEFANSEIDKGQSEKLLRIFVKDNAVPGTYNIWLRSQGQVSYSRNPEKAERLKAAHEEAKQKVEAAKQAVAQAGEKKTAAVAALAEATKQLEAAQATLPQKQKEIDAAKQLLATIEPLTKDAAAILAAAQQQLQQADDRVKQATAAQQAAAQAATAADAALVQAEKGLTTAKAVVLAAAAKLAQAKAELEKDAENQALKANVFDADQAVQKANQGLAAADESHTSAIKARDEKRQSAAQAQAAVEKMTQEQAVAKTAAAEAAQANESAAKKLAEAQQGVKTAEAAYQTAQQALAKAQEQVKAAEVAKTQAEAAEKSATDAVPALEMARAAAEKAANDAATAAQPKNINFTPPSTPITLIVKPAPVKLAAAVPNNGALKKGEKLEVKVTVTRQNGFAGPVTLSLPPLPGISGITSDAPELLPDQTEGTLTLSAAADATEGPLPNLVIRARAEFNGQAEVDLPVTVNVTN